MLDIYTKMEAKIKAYMDDQLHTSEITKDV